MKKLYKRILSLLLCVLLFGGVLSLCASAENYSGTYGSNIHWQLDTGTGVLSITGTGAMPDATSSSSSYAPWYEYRSLIKSAVIAKGVTRIGNYAFYYCSSLTSVTIPNSVTSIGDYAFYGCESLTSVTIPIFVTRIGNYAFYYCRSLTSVTIPNSVTSIGNHAFCWCSSLTRVTIPSSVTSIGDYAFFDCGITSVTIPNSVTSIGDHAFDGCISLTSVTIPDSVTSIGECAFDGCRSLTSVTIPDSVTSIGGCAFADCRSLTSVTIPDSVTSISGGAFMFCSSLLSVTIPNSVISIGDSAFEGCSSLRSVTIPDSVTSIGWRAFSGCSSLTSVTIPNSVTRIGDYAFADCSSLARVTIPDSVSYIGSFAFRGCSSLTSITIPDSVTSIAYSAFEYCNSLTSVTIPNSVTSISGGAFMFCSSLLSVTIPNSVTSIGWYAFYGCRSLASVTIPDSVTSIGGSAFSGCSSLTDVFYTGSETQWKAIYIGSDNEPLTGAAIHYNSDGGVLPTRNAAELWKPDVLFSRDSSVYDPELAYVAGWLCDQSEAETDGDVGKGEQKMRAAFDALGFDANDRDVWYYGDTLCFGVASSEKDHLLVIVLRGTKSEEEAINDKINGANKEMWGFHAYDYPFDFYQKVRDYLITWYIPQHTYLEAAPIKVLITGHSLGGAGANLLAFDMIKHATLKQGNTWYENVLSPENIYCYTFGALDSINDLYDDGSEVPTLPVKDGYENIHNIYNLKDTFGKYGVYPLNLNFIGEIVKKIGQMHFFSKDYGVDASEYKEYSFLGHKIQIRVPTNTTNHNMPTYLDAIYYDTIGKASIPSDLYNTFHRKVGVAECPVDVEIYENGVLVGRTNRNVVDQTVTTIDLAVINDVKYFPMENDRDYRVIFRAFDKGEMTYTVYEKGLTHPNDAAVFRDVALTEGKTMTSEIGKAKPVEDVRLYVTNESGEKTAEILPDGSEKELASLRVNAPAAATYKKPFTVSADARNLPAGARVEWTADNAKVQLSPAADGQTCTVKSAFKGTVTLTATAYGADGETLAKQSETVTVKYAWWQWLIRIFLFGWIWY